MRAQVKGVLLNDAIAAGLPGMETDLRSEKLRMSPQYGLARCRRPGGRGTYSLTPSN